MADVTWGVKVPSELKEQINRFMQESGLQGKDFMQQLINLYSLEKAKDAVPEVAEDMRELQGLTQRINDIYLSIGYRIENIVKLKDSEMEKELAKKDLIISDLQDKLSDLKAQHEGLMEVYKNKVNDESELLSRVNQLTDNIENIKALNEEYKGKIDTLTGIIDEYKGYKQENDSLELEINKLTKRIDELYSEIYEKDFDIDKLNANIENLNKDISKMKSEYEDEIVKVKEELELDKDKAILELKKKHQDKIADLQQDYNEKVSEYQNKLDELQSRYNASLEKYHAKYLESLNSIKTEEKE